MNLAIGSSTRESVIGISKCSVWWWAIQGIFIVACVLFTWIAVHVAKKETHLKQKFGNVGIAQSDLDLNSNKMIRILIALGFGGGWVAGCVGLGGGAIYNPMLISMGVPPAVSSATGLYLVMFSKIASCFVYYLNGELNLIYGLWVALWSTVGMVLGLIGAQWYMKKNGRQSLIVWCLVVIFAVSIVSVPIFGGISLKNQMDEGMDIYAFSPVCETKK